MHIDSKVAQLLFGSNIYSAASIRYPKPMEDNLMILRMF